MYLNKIWLLKWGLIKNINNDSAEQMLKGSLSIPLLTPLNPRETFPFRSTFRNGGHVILEKKWFLHYFHTGKSNSLYLFPYLILNVTETLQYGSTVFT